MNLREELGFYARGERGGGGLSDDNIAEVFVAWLVWEEGGQAAGGEDVGVEDVLVDGAAG